MRVGQRVVIAEQNARLRAERTNFDLHTQVRVLLADVDERRLHFLTFKRLVRTQRRVFHANEMPNARAKCASSMCRGTQNSTHSSASSSLADIAAAATRCFCASLSTCVARRSRRRRAVCDKRRRCEPQKRRLTIFVDFLAAAVGRFAISAGVVYSESGRIETFA